MFTMAEEDSLDMDKEELSRLRESNDVLKKQIWLFRTVIEKQSSALAMIEEEQTKTREGARTRSKKGGEEQEADGKSSAGGTSGREGGRRE